ncbi:pheromone-processing carboxypeptidase KEX1-like, partial [Penaeus monodon]|uniref:pheromone-processing carboxypeptidase KEX1-like n=1 Tax=Penaeus monodon TaxID=6687 RepID=UPI0018A7187B
LVASVQAGWFFGSSANEESHDVKKREVNGEPETNGNDDGGSGDSSGDGSGDDDNTDDEDVRDDDDDDDDIEKKRIESDRLTNKTDRAFVYSRVVGVHRPYIKVLKGVKQAMWRFHGFSLEPDYPQETRLVVTR